MANQFVNLPVPVGNGSGAAVDISGLAGLKAVICSGNAVATINVEINNDAGQLGSWQTVASFQNKGFSSIVVAAKWMRVTVVGYTRGTPQIDVGAAPGTTTFASLPTTVSNGSGAAVDVSAAGVLKTIHVGGPFRGGAAIEISEDGVNNWAQIASFNQPGLFSGSFVAKWMRVTRAGVPVIGPGLPLVTVGATNDTGGGGGAAVVHNGTLTGSGVVGDPLGVVPGSLDTLVAVSADGVTIAGDGKAAGTPLHAVFAGFAGNVAVATDASLTGSGTTGNPLSVVASAGTKLSVNLTNGDVGTDVAGTPVYVSANNTARAGKADAAATASVRGIYSADTATGVAGQVVVAGPVTLTTGQWDAITGDVGGLVAGKDYYLDPTTAGKLTRTAPTTAGQLDVAIMFAVSTTVAIVFPRAPIQL